MTDNEETAAPGDERPTVFLSYSRGDRKRALAVIGALEKAGIAVWWDGLLEGGDTFLPTTEAALESSDAVVVLWSKTSVDSNWVRDEATRGRDRGCLVPLTIDGTSAPLGFRQIQMIDVSKWRGRADAPEIQAAIRAITVHAHKPRQVIAPSPTASASRRGLLIGGGAAIAAAATYGGWKWLAPVSAATADNTIAVIPFANLGAPEDAYFSAGLSEDLRAALSRNRLLQIAAPTSSAEFSGAQSDVQAIASKLNVAHILRGSVRHGVDRVRIAVELVNGSTANLDWTQTLDRKLSDVLAMQAEIAAVVSEALAAALNAKAIAEGRSGDLAQVGGTASPEAFDAYLRGRALAQASQDEASDRAALARFDEAVKFDPKYASALAERSKMLAAIANETGQARDVRKYYDAAVVAGRAAVASAPKLAQAHAALGYALNNGMLDPRAAQRPYERARELGSGDADILRNYALFSSYNARAAEASQAIATSLTLDPLNAKAFRAAATIAYSARDYDTAIARAGDALVLTPKLSVANWALGSAYYLKGDNTAAAKAFAAEPIPMFRLQGEAIVKHRAGDRAGAQADFDALARDYGSNASYQLTQVLTQWGNRDAALIMLERAVSQRDAGLLLARTDPMLDPLREAPRFRDLLSRMGLS